MRIIINEDNMYVYKISQNENDDYNTYDSAVVIAKDEYQAKRLHPDGWLTWKDNIGWIRDNNDEGFHTSTWANNIDSIKVEYIGIADKSFDKPQVIIASYNAG